MPAGAKSILHPFGNCSLDGLNRLVEFLRRNLIILDGVIQRLNGSQQLLIVRLPFLRAEVGILAQITKSNLNESM